MVSQVELRGADTLERTLRRAADDLVNPDVNQKAAQSLLDKADPPRDSGALDASGTVQADAEGGTVTYDEVYAGVIHNGWPDHNIDAQPWLYQAVDQQRTDLADVYVDHIADLLGTVHGI